MSFKGKRKGMPRPPKKRGGPVRKSGHLQDAEGDAKVAVIVANQRGSRITFTLRLDGLGADSITQALRSVLTPDAVLSTDGNDSYGVVAKALGIEAGHFVAGYHGHGGKGMSRTSTHTTND